MKMKKYLVSCLLALGVLSASAQDAAETKTEYVFNPHFYVQIQPGIQHTLGEVSFGDLNSFTIQATVGRQFTPVVGARFAVNGWQSKGGSKIANKQYDWAWNYVAPSIDATFNLSNLFCGYNPNRLFNLGVFAGLGVNVAFSNDEAWEANDAIIANVYPHQTLPTGVATPLEYLWSGNKVRLFGQAGVTGDFRLTNAVSVGLELSANTLSDRYNSKKADNSDWYFNALVGVKINLGATHSTRTVPVSEPEIRYVDRIVEKVVEKVVEAAPAPAPKAEPLRREIYFSINSSKISATEAVKVKEVADYLNKYPEAKVEIGGYADAGTGTSAINERLAAQRTAAVVKVLTEQYRIAADRIISDSKGSRVQPFAENDKNRVVICIAE